MRAVTAVRRRLTFSNVLAVFAVALVLTTGTAYAAATITSAQIVNGTIAQVDVKPNSLGSRVIKDNGVRSVDIRDGGVASIDILDQTITADDLATGSVGAGELADDSVGSGEVIDFGLSNQDVGVLFAEVSAAGSVDNSSGNVTAAKLPGTGLYEVDFARDLSPCTGVASVGSSGESAASGEASVADRVGNVEAFFVDTNNSAGGAADLPFRIVVVC